MAARLRQSCLADPAHKTEPGTCRTCSKGTSGTLAFGPMRAAWVLCSALRCAAPALPSRSSLLGLDFPTRPSSAPALNHLTSQVRLFLPVLLLRPALPAVDALGSSLQSSLSHGCLLVREANLLRPVPVSLELDLDATSTYHQARLHLLSPSTRQLPSSSLLLPSSSTATPLPRLSIPRHPSTRLPVFHWRG